MPPRPASESGLTPTSRRDLSPLEQVLAQSDPVIYDPQGYVVRSGGPGEHPQFEGRWPQPNLPLSPWLPHGAEPRQFYPLAGYNLVYMPRGEVGLNLTPFQVLRTLADTSDILRILIEDVKASIQGLTCDFAVDDNISDAKTSELASVRQFFRKPDGIRDWNTWLTMLLEELLTIDAVSLYRWRTKDGTPLGLLNLDGSTIKPLADFHGLPPAPPEPAYQQVVMGRIETEFTRPWGDAETFAPDGEDKIELSYLPRNSRAWSLYGQSPVERVIITVNLALRRQMHLLAYYTDGTMPDGLYRVPATWNAAQIKQYQAQFDELHAGESGQRRKIKFIPGGPDTGLERTHEETYQYELDEYLWRVGCWAFGVSPLPMAKMANRAVAQQMDQGETDQGIRPLLKWISETVINPAIREFLGFEGIHHVWTDEKAEDKKLTVDRHVAYVKEGIITRAEARNDLGMPDVPDGGDPLLVDTATGPVEVPDEAALQDKKDQAAALAEAARKAPVAPAKAPGGANGGPPPPSPGAAGAPPSSKEAAADLKRWRKVAARDLKERRAPRAFKSEAIPEPVRAAIAEWVAYSRSEEDLRWGFATITKSRRPLATVRRRIRHEQKLRKVIAAHFAARVPHLVKVLEPIYQRARSRKAEGDDADDAIDAALEWRIFVKNIAEPLSDAYLDGETVASDVGGLEVSFGLTSQQAIDYAEERGAELIGMKIVDGRLVDNPNAKWSVPQSTRDYIKNLLTKALDEGASLDEFQEAVEQATMWTWRAEMVARTEVAFALNAGAIDTYESAGIEKVTVLDGPGCLREGHDDAEPGVDGEVWTLDEADEDPLGHPNCRRDFAPVVEE